MLSSKKDRIDAETKTIEDIFTSSVALKIPDYQRPFDWKKEEATEFWEDLKHTNGSESNLFLGTIVLDTSNNEAYEVVDGQQRLTTICLFLIALRTIAIRNGTEEDLNLASKLHSFLNIENRRSGRDEGTKSKLTVSISIRDALDPIIIDRDWDCEYSKLVSNKQIIRIKPILEYFLEVLKDYKHDEISETVDCLYDSYVVVLGIKDKTQALEIFEHANVRGMELNAADLLKSFFIACIDNKTGEELENRWLQITANTENVIRMIKHFGWTKFPKSTVSNRKRYYGELKKYGKNNEEKLLDELEEFAEAYGLVESGEISDFQRWVEKNGVEVFIDQRRFIEFVRPLRGLRLFRVVQTYPLITAALVSYKKTPTKQSANALIELVSVLEKYHFINSFISQRRGNEVEVLYADSSKEFLGEKELYIIVNQLKNKLLNQLASFSEFESKFKELTHDTSPNTLKALYYLFDRLNNYEWRGVEIRDIYNPKLTAIKGDWEVEHILSQKPYPPSEIKNYYEYIHNIGNLLVVPKGTNGTLKNKPVDEKVPILKERVGSMRTVVEFCTKYEAGSYGAFSTEEDVKVRTDEITYRAYFEVFAIVKNKSA